MSETSAQLGAIEIANGTIVDGTGRPPYRAGVIVENGLIKSVGTTGANATVRLDASGCIVAPGFIDSHGHGDFLHFVLPTADNRIHDGVTTEVSSNCGYGLFPLDEKLRARRQESLERLQPDGAAFRISWLNGREFYTACEHTQCAINRVYQVAHGNLRRVVVGENDRPATDDELKRMGRILGQEIPWTSGMSSGLAYPPACFADTGELVELARVVRAHRGLYTSHIRNEGDCLEQAVEEAIEIGLSAGAVHISHLKTAWPRNWHKISFLRERLARARAEGLDLTADRYPYCAAATDLDYILPEWLSDGGVDAEMERLTAENTVGKLRAHMRELVRVTPDFWQRVMISRTNSGHPLDAPDGGSVPPEGRSIAELSELTRTEPEGIVLELLRRERTRVDAIYRSMCEENLREILSWNFVMIGSDSGIGSVSGPLGRGSPHPRTFGTFARYLKRYTELSGKDGTPRLEKAIMKLTSMTAKRFRLSDRGTIAQGLAADLTVFDPSSLEDMATFEKPHQYSRGIRHVLVNGVPVIREYEMTGMLPGRALKLGTNPPL